MIRSNKGIVLIISDIGESYKIFMNGMPSTLATTALLFVYSRTLP